VNLSWLNKTTSFIQYWFKKITYWFKAEKKNGVRLVEEYDEKLILQLSPKRLPHLKQLKYLPRFLNKKEKRLVVSFILIGSISLLSFIFSFTWRHTILIPKAGGSYTEALIGTPQYINPIFGSTNDVDTDLIKLIYSGLLKYNNNLELENDIAESYEISPDGKTYTFTIKPNIRWHDNKELTTKDIAFTINMIQDIRNNSPLEPSFRGVKVNQLDDRKIQFVLEKPFAPFLHSLTVGILPAHAWENISSQSYKLAELNLKPIGSGPWQFDGLKKNKDGNLISYSLKPFENFYGQKPYIKNLNFKFYANYDLAWQALLEQNVDGISFIPKEKKQSLEKNNRQLQIYNLQLPQYTGIFINENKNDILKEQKIRNVLELTIDKNKLINDVFAGEALALASPLLPGLPGYNQNLNTNPYNPEEAIKILTELNWQKKDEDQFLYKDNKILELTLTTVDYPDNIKMANMIRDFWQEVGIKTNLNIVPASSIQRETIRTRNYELLLFGEILGADPDFYPFWHSSQQKDSGFNLTSFNNKRADALLEQARETNDLNKKSELFSQFENIILEYKPAIFLFQPTYSYLLNKKVLGFKTTRINIPSDRLNDSTNWYIKTKRRFKTEN